MTVGAERPSALLLRSMPTMQRIATTHRVSRIRVFGSAAIGRDRPGSDLDLLVDFQGPHDLVDLVTFKDDLSQALGCTVDVATENALHPRLRARILAEAVDVWRA